MRHQRKLAAIVLSSALMLAMTACGGSSQTSGGGSSAGTAAEAVNLREKVDALYTTEEDLGLSGKYTSSAEIAEAAIDPELVGTWKTADGSVSYTYREDGTATASTEGYGGSDYTFTCLTSGNYKLIAEDLEMTEITDGVETTVPSVNYVSYQIADGALYFTIVDALDPNMNQSISQVIVAYKADEKGDISASIAKNPISPASYYGEWTYGDMEDRKLTIDEKGFTAEGMETLPVSVSESGKLVVGSGDGATEYSAGIAYEKLYDNTNGLQITGENYALALSYTGKDENDRPNLADAMNDWHADYDYEEFYFTLNARRPKN